MKTCFPEAEKIQQRLMDLHLTEADIKALIDLLEVVKRITSFQTQPCSK